MQYKNGIENFFASKMQFPLAAVVVLAVVVVVNVVVVVV
jgi:hypothetical protein